MKCAHCNGAGEVDIAAMSAGPRLRFHREHKGLSLRQVTAKTGVPHAVVANYENERIENPSFRHIMALCNLYDIDPQELIFNDSNDQKPS